MVWPETESAVQTMPAIAITKNMPVVPERPKCSKHDRRDDDGEHRHAGDGIARGGGNGVGGHRGEEEGEEQRQRQTDGDDRPGDREMAKERGDARWRPPRRRGEWQIIGISRSVRSGCASFAVAEGAQRDAERSRHDAQRFEDADDAGGGDGAHADEAHVVAIDLDGRHLRDGKNGGIDGDGRCGCR